MCRLPRAAPAPDQSQDPAVWRPQNSAEQAEFQDEGFHGPLALLWPPVPYGAADLGSDVKLLKITEDPFTAVPQRDVVPEQEGGVMHLGRRHPAEYSSHDAALQTAGPSGDPLAAMASPHAVAHI